MFKRPKAAAPAGGPMGPPGIGDGHAGVGDGGNGRRPRRDASAGPVGPGTPDGRVAPRRRPRRIGSPDGGAPGGPSSGGPGSFGPGGDATGGGAGRGDTVITMEKVLKHMVQTTCPRQIMKQYDITKVDEQRNSVTITAGSVDKLREVADLLAQLDAAAGNAKPK